jgi:hypothetical protein
MTEQGNKAAAAARIRALLAKTTSNGCTEAEAMAAAAKAGELMDRYSLSMSDVEIKQEKCTTRASEYVKTHPVEGCAVAIARFCGCKVWRAGYAGKKTLHYFGLPQDTEVAHYLTDLIRNSMEAEFRAYMRGPGKLQDAHGKTLRRNFMLAMAARVAQRLDVMSAERERTAHTSTGTALVVVRNAVVNEFKALGFKLKRGSASRGRYNGDAHRAGRDAGDRVNITTGVGGSSKLSLR